MGWGMTQVKGKRPSVGLRFKALVKERGVAIKVFDDFLAKRFSSEKSKINTFLREGLTASAPVRQALSEFAKEKLGVELNDCWFDTDWHPSAPIDVFMNSNSAYNSIIEQACGHFLHISPRASVPNNYKIWRVGRVVLERNDGYFGFKMGSEQSEVIGDNPYSGFVTCHSDTLFLIGFDTKLHEKVISLILRKPLHAPELAGVRFYGMQVGTLPVGNMPNGRAIAKRVVIIDQPTWTDVWELGNSMPSGVSDWLGDGGSSLNVDIVAQRLDEA
jgi:hypothetical protein